MQLIVTLVGHKGRFGRKRERENMGARLIGMRLIFLKVNTKKKKNVNQYFLITFTLD